MVSRRPPGLRPKGAVAVEVAHAQRPWVRESWLHLRQEARLFIFSTPPALPGERGSLLERDDAVGEADGTGHQSHGLLILTTRCRRTGRITVRKPIAARWCSGTMAGGSAPQARCRGQRRPLAPEPATAGRGRTSITVSWRGRSRRGSPTSGLRWPQDQQAARNVRMVLVEAREVSGGCRGSREGTWI